MFQQGYHFSNQSDSVPYGVLTIMPYSSEVCKSTVGLKRHMVVHMEQISQQDPIDPMKTLMFICHLCFQPYKSAAGLKSPIVVIHSEKNMQVLVERFSMASTAFGLTVSLEKTKVVYSPTWYAVQLA